MYCSKHDQQSNNWLYALVFNSISIELFDCVIPTYNEICSSQQGKTILTNLILYEIFFMSCNIMKYLKIFLKIF